MKLWAHQERGLDLLRKGFGAGARRGCLVVPTGGGKTVLALSMIAGSLAKGRRALFVADRRILVTQAAKAAHRLDIPCGVLMRDAGPDWCDPTAPLQVVSKDSLVSWLRRPDFELPPADLIVTDECHKSISETFDVLRRQYPNAWEVGLTATPARGDGRGLGERYEFLSQPTTYEELIGLGVLVRPDCFDPYGTRPGVKPQRPTKAAMVGDAVTWWRKLADGLRTFVFASGVAHSIALRDEFRKAGVRAEHIDASTDDSERDEYLRQLGSGELNVVCNCAVLRYGVDVPAVECAQLLAPMGSIVDYRQSVGRILRASPGKTRAVLIDHAGSVQYHGFPHADLPWTLDAAEDHVARQRQRMERGEAPTPITCPQCHTLFSGTRTCPGCGWVPVRKGQAVGTRKGTLKRVNEIAQTRHLDHEEFRRAWMAALATCVKKGFKVAAAAQMFKQATGALPWEVGVEPLPSRGDWQRPAYEVFPQFLRGTRDRFA